MRIQHNIMAMNAYRNLGTNNSALSKNLEKLSSGYRINRAGDDAAGLAISEKMRAQISGLDQAQANVNDGISLVQTAEGAMQEIHDMLNRMVTLATQAANGTYDTTDVENIEEEVNALKDEIDRICESSNFNGITLLDGSLGAGEVELDTANSDLKAGAAVGDTIVSAFRGNLEEGTYTLAVDGTNTSQINISLEKADGSVEVSSVDLTDWATSFEVDAGSTNTINFGDFSVDLVNSATEAGADVIAALDGLTVIGAASGTSVATDGLTLQIGDAATDTLTVHVNNMDSTALNLDTLDITTNAGANAAIDTVKTAINTVSAERAKLGAIQNRLEHTNNNLGVMEENIQNAEATIRDTDIAEEMMAYTKNNILIQSAQAMLAQANQVPQGVLQLMQ